MCFFFSAGELKELMSKISEYKRDVAKEEGRANGLETALNSLKQDISKLQEEKTNLVAKVGLQETFTIWVFSNVFTSRPTLDRFSIYNIFYLVAWFQNETHLNVEYSIREA